MSARFPAPDERRRGRIPHWPDGVYRADREVDLEIDPETDHRWATRTGHADDGGGQRLPRWPHRCTDARARRTGGALLAPSAGLPLGDRHRVAGNGRTRPRVVP